MSTITYLTRIEFGEGQIFLGLALLRATSAHEMFSQSYAKITVENILEFLLLNRTFPRAIIASLLQIEYALRCLAGEQKGFFINTAQKKVQRLLLAGVKPERAPVLAGGFAIMAAALAELRVERINPVGGALRLGVLYDLLGRSVRKA